MVKELFQKFSTLEKLVVCYFFFLSFSLIVVYVFSHSGGNYFKDVETYNQHSGISLYLSNKLSMKSGSINPYCVYITCNPRRTTFYTGVTNDLERRMFEHFTNRGNKNTFAGKYFCHVLIYYECYPYMNMAIKRENEIKDLSKKKKVDLIKALNPKLKKLLL